MPSIFILISLLAFSATTAHAKGTADPNSYFHEKSWSVDVKHPTFVYAKSVYNGEPVQKPNSLMAEHRCGYKKKRIPMFKGLKYCGIDSVAVVGGKLEVMFVDFNYKNSKGYCTKRRKQYFKIPSCSKKPAKKTKKG